MCRLLVVESETTGSLGDRGVSRSWRCLQKSYVISIRAYVQGHPIFFVNIKVVIFSAFYWRWDSGDCRPFSPSHHGPQRHSHLALVLRIRGGHQRRKIAQKWRSGDILDARLTRLACLAHIQSILMCLEAKVMRIQPSVNNLFCVHKRGPPQKVSWITRFVHRNIKRKLWQMQSFWAAIMNPYYRH